GGGGGGGRVGGERGARPRAQKGMSLAPPPLGKSERSSAPTGAACSSLPRSRPLPPPLAPLPPAPPRPPTKRMFCATISVDQRFWPSLSCHCRVRSEPSIKTVRPFERYCLARSACLPNSTTECHSVASCQPPLPSGRRSFVAMRRFATVVPPCV